ncbi:MAG: hypothetical protein H0X12_16305, partial [Nocardioides sp.]|nr:hypothetical protein [Nocardioides sp.]
MAGAVVLGQPALSAAPGLMFADSMSNTRIAREVRIIRADKRRPASQKQVVPDVSAGLHCLPQGLSLTSMWESPVRTTTPRQLRDTPVDVKLVLSALWIAMLFVFAYVDIFGFYRADILDAALDGKVATTALTINQMFLTGALIYILLPSVMAVLALVLRPRVNRMTNVVVSLLYSLTIVYSCRGETWV